jgi:hypothetical protein
MFNWLQVLGTAELAQIPQCVRQQFHAIVPLLEAVKTQQQPLKRASDSLRKKWTCDLPMKRAVSRRHVS